MFGIFSALGSMSLGNKQDQMLQTLLIIKQIPNYKKFSKEEANNMLSEVREQTTSGYSNKLNKIISLLQEMTE